MTLSTPLDRLHPLRLMAAYNQWMNTRLYETARQLPPAAVEAPRGAFFGSILGTLNHLVVADTLWLHRFAQHPALQAKRVDPATPDPLVALHMVCEWPTPMALGEPVGTDLTSLWPSRQVLDAAILALIQALSDADLDHPLSYFNMKKVPQRKPTYSLLLHFFNHQTHHRGQATTLLSQAGVDVGVTDLLALIPAVDGD